MNMLIACAFVCSLVAAVQGYAIGLGLGGYDSYAVPNYAYNYAIKDVTGGAQEKSETRIGGLTKEQQSVVVNHLGPHGYGSGVSQQNTAIVRNSGHGVAAINGLGLGAPVLGGLGYAGAGLGGLGYGAPALGGLGLGGLGYAGAGLGGLGYGGLGLAGGLY